LINTTLYKGPKRYYLQNFHFQSGGWMTDASADRYDTQVEVLFKGTANPMRRQVLPQLFEVFTGHNQRTLRLIDLGCGTGRSLDLVKQAWPRLPSLGLDLSEAYIRHARRHLKRWSRLDLVVANAEAIPAPDNSVDAVTSIFHDPRTTATGAPNRHQGVRACVEARGATNPTRLASDR
jgi:ubiquinone/menaquinone biosynthesis C-methylase UbiE